MEKSNKAYRHRQIGGRAGKLRLEHHVVWETANGPIPDGFEIHHIDHNKQNNDLENLQLLSASDHQRMHSPNYALLDGVWVRICPDCRRINVSFIRPLCDSCRARRARIERRASKTE